MYKNAIHVYSTGVHLLYVTYPREILLYGIRKNDECYVKRKKRIVQIWIVFLIAPSEINNKFVINRGIQSSVTAPC